MKKKIQECLHFFAIVNFIAIKVENVQQLRSA